ncbi:hypothetical protein PtrSN002B_003212 [Pyrenophora tritici-repentis]|uniref:Protamine-P2 domain containing protein n=2 Tax=Pyrenophora tritici-repentis TaxID=45151 RepID=A0A2W1H7M1_9PLEO|nr:uncharacterized protein PTRG_03183 [Pyrenophora tritici-repentis Pt-1C-BFP]KAA8622715.1 hypothetical protein PtrV1_04021 [Pyrenophora tritici-repentis]EDU45706.1 hypothetical protein PTRG_03183 [Pyrenophora tritici-repentis Pt-1C-BFP]KAF7451704.1 hypothetical protein A1F99_034810 [Pyrenophora tritici-repentis]KAF7575183.1 Protamine-P2 domain containing protein [Pyrenophora tritici-repentis]KAG9386060.1 hypothetical protein A1F94_002810 [Pyrenophora tritici-repentis]
MQFSAIIATVFMAAFAIAAPIASDEVTPRQNHGMCVSGTTAGVTQIPDC